MALCAYKKCDVDEPPFEYCPECLRDVLANRNLGKDTPGPVQTEEEAKQTWDAIQIVSKRLHKKS